MSNPYGGLGWVGGWAGQAAKGRPISIGPVPRYDPRTPQKQPTSTVKESPAPGSKSGSGGTGGAPTPSGPAVQFNQSAFDYLSQWLGNLGLSSLSGNVRDLVMQGITDPDSISLMLQNTPQWKQRFAGNEQLRAKGLDVLSVSEYLATEKSYAQVMKQYGLPQGFYDDPSDFANWIGNSVSPNELNQRASMYSNLAQREDTGITKQLQAMGLSKGDLMAYMMDPTRAQPLLTHKYQEALVGGAAFRNGLTPAGVSHLVDEGITEQQANQGFGQIGQMKPTTDLLGDIYGDHLSEADLEAATFENNAEANRKVGRLASQERASFNGSAGTNGGSLTTNTGGLF